MPSLRFVRVTWPRYPIMSPTGSLQTAQHESKVPHPYDEDAEYEDAERSFQPRSPRFWMIIIGVYASIFLVALDRMIIATAIPSITNEFHSIVDTGWYGSAYMLTAAIFVPLSGRIYQLYPTKWVFLLSILIFEIGSALCGAAPSSVAFIIGRAIAGIGAAGIFSGGIMIIVPLVPLRRRPIFTSFFGIAFGVSSVLGPLIGGSFTDNRALTWRWCFYINLPIGGFTFVAILLFLHLYSRPREKISIIGQVKQLDPIGLLFLVPSMVCLILALQWGGTTDPWSAPRIIGLLVTFAILLIAFIMVEIATPDTAMAPMRVVLNRSVGGSMLFMFLVSGAMMVVVYYLSIWFQAAQGQSAKESGIRTIPLVLSMTVMGIFSAILTEKVGYYNPAMLLCPILSAVGGGMLSTLTPRAGSSHWIGYQVIFGFGVGSGFQTSTLAPQTVLPRADVPLGMAMMFFMQQLGGSTFIPVAQNIFSRQLLDSLSGLGVASAKAVVDAGATAYRDLVPQNEIQAVMNAYSSALTRVFILVAAISAATILGAAIVEWKSIKGKKSPPSNSEDVTAGTAEEDDKTKAKNHRSGVKTAQ